MFFSGYIHSTEAYRQMNFASDGPRLALAARVCGAQAGAAASPEYDLLLKGGHVIDAKNNIDAVRDVAIKDGKIAKVARSIAARTAIKTVNVTGMYVYRD